MRDYHRFALYLTAVLYTALPAKADEHHIHCPAEYPAQHIALTSFAGWTSELQDNYPLRAAGAMEGPVEQKGFLKPVLRELENKREETYDLRSVGNKWAWCGYGLDGNLMLSRKLPSSVKRCVVISTRTIPALKDYYEVTQFICK